MSWYHTAYTVLLFVTTGVLVALALYARQRRGIVGATAFMWLALVVAEWALTYALELASSGGPAKVFWAKLQYLGIGSVPLAWLIYALHYTGKARWLTRRNLTLLLILPVLTLLLVFTNEAHGLIWSQIDAGAADRFTALDVTHGPWFWVYWIFACALILAGSVILIRMTVVSRNLYRRQASALLLAAAAPWIGNALYVFRLNPLHPFDLTPAGFALSALAAGWALFRFRLLEVVPVAHSTIVAGLRDGIIVLDARNRVVDLNPTAERVLSWSVAAALGQPVERLLADHPALVACCRDAIEERIEVTLGQAEAPRSYEAQITLLRNRRGQISGQLLILHDVTERKRSAAALHAAKEAAERATRAKSEFLATMSHEIRTPMTGVMGVTDLLLLTDLTDQQRELVELMRSSGDAMLRIINELLDFSRIESGKLYLEHTPFLLQACLEESLDVVAVEAATKQLDLAYSIDPQVPITLVGDSARLRQILVNLLGNAIKFTDSGEVVVSVTASNLGESRYQVRFAVKDTGIGIPLDQLSRLFESFSQIDPAAVRSRGGAGLGLAISKRLSELMGGAIWVESEEGCGSTFYFTILAEAVPSEARIYVPAGLPHLIGKRLLDIFEKQPVRVTPADLPARTEQPDTGSATLRVLIAEDDIVTQKLIVHILHKLGYQADVASNGLEALQAIEQQYYDLALLDAQLPEVDGLALARQICLKWPQDRRPYMIAVTGNIMPGDRERCLNAGMDDYIAKPVRLAELVEAIGKRWSLPGQSPTLVAPIDATASAFTAIRSKALGSVLEAFDENRPQLPGELIDCYLVDTPELLATMHTAVARRDAGALQSAAHKLKSSSALLGATALVGMCRELERLGKLEAIDNSLERVLQIEAEYLRFKVALELHRAAQRSETPQ